MSEPVSERKKDVFMWKHVKKLLKRFIRSLREWVSEEETPPAPLGCKEPVPFDYDYQWLGQSMRTLMNDSVCAGRPHYAWGILMGAALGRVLGYRRISVLEFGVAGGAGLVAMERAAELTEQLTEIGIDVRGFDTGKGLPKPKDYRDVPFAWSEGYYPIDHHALEHRLRRARLMLGLVKETLPAFVSENASPVAFVGIDLCLYSSAREALGLFEADYDRLLPRVAISFRCIYGKNYTDYAGERLAISEFNLEHETRKISPMYGLRYLVPQETLCALPVWPEYLYAAHLFHHPRYGELDSLQKSMNITVEGHDQFLPVNKPG